MRAVLSLFAQKGMVSEPFSILHTFASMHESAFTENVARKPLNKSAAALSGSFAPTFRFENLEIHKVFLQFPNLNLEQNPSLTALAI